MAFTVYRPGGTRDSEFQAYLRLLRQQGVDIGKARRVQEPGNGQRWLPVWDEPSQAEAFATELTERTGEPAWQVTEVEGPASEGPLGPILIQLLREPDGFSFSVPPLSEAIIQSVYPQAVPRATHTFTGVEAWKAFRQAQGNLPDLVRELVPLLTGLNLEQLDALGYAVADVDSGETLVEVLPAVAHHV